jgi:hypothetical protein
VLVATTTRVLAVDLGAAERGDAPLERSFEGAGLRGPLAGPIPMACPRQ